LDIALRQAQGGELVEPFVIRFLVLGFFYVRNIGAKRADLSIVFFFD
jgi:hypothetical protein